MNGGAQSTDIGQIDRSEGEDEDVNAVQQRRPHDRSNQKDKQESNNEPKPFNRRSAKSSPSASRQSNPRDKSGVMRRNRVQTRKSVSFATGVVERAILPRSAQQQMIAKTWMKSAQSHPAMLTVICLVWIGAMTPPRRSTQRPNGTTELEVERSCRHLSILARLTMCFPSQCVPSIHWRRPPSRREELF